MYKASPKLIFWLCVIGTVCTAILEFTFGPMPFFSGLILVILLTILVQKDLYTYLFSGSAIVIIAVASFMYSRPLTTGMLIHLLFTSSVACLTALLVLYIKKFNRSAEGERLQLNALFEFANEGIILTDDQGKILLMNPKARQLLSYEASDVIGRQISDLFPQKTGEQNPNYLASYYKDPSAWKKEADPSLDAVKKDGSAFPVEISVSHYLERKGSFVLIFVTDISERRASENEMIQQKARLEMVMSDVRKMNVELENKVAERTLILQEALRELEKSQQELNKALSDEKELNEIKSRFVSMASHEFRTPLSTILSSAVLISKYAQTEENPQREKHVSRIKDSVRVLTDLLEDFLNLGKLDEGKVVREVNVFDVKEFFLDVVEELGTNLKKGQVISLVTEGEPVFNTDKRLLKNVLINLLNNAMKFSMVDQQIDVRIENSGEKLMLQIKDRGIGIAKEDMPHLFSTFYRGKNAINIHGTGLGLHIVKRYVNMLEGDITLTSEINQGTTCSIGLPNLKNGKV